MAKQKVDTVTKEMGLDHKWPALLNMTMAIWQVDNEAKKLQDKYNQLKNRELELINLGTIYAGTTMKDGKYLYLIYPRQDGAPRKREYIGADADKIAETFAAIRRGEELVKVKQAINHLDRVVNAASYYISQASARIR